MPHPRSANPAQISERFIQVTALGIGLAGLAWGLEAAQAFVPARYVGALDMASFGLGIIVLALVGSATLWLKLTRAQTDCQVRDSFIWSAYRQSAARTFTFVIIAVMGMKLLTANGLSGIAPDILFQLLFAAIALFFAGAFFLATVRKTVDESEFNGVV
jgi:hypothetical protein